MRKMMFLTGAALGYVLGARAGRERYEQINRIAGRIRANPQVQHAAEVAATRGGEVAHKMAETANEKAHVVAGAVADKAPSWMPGVHKDETPPGTYSAGTMGMAANGRGVH